MGWKLVDGFACRYSAHVIVMAETVKTSIEASVSKTKAVTVEEGSRASAVVEKAAAADPALLNEMNKEPVAQSRILWGGSYGVLVAVGSILVQVGQHGDDFQGYNLDIMVPSIMALHSALYVLYGRFWPNLKPLFWRWTHPAG